MAVRVIIDGQTADLFESKEFPIKLDFQIEDENDLSVIKGSGSSQTYKLPGTATNIKIFEYFGRVSEVDSSGESTNIKSLKPCVIEVDGIPVLTGKIKLLRVLSDSNATSRKGISFEVVFFSGNSDWFVDMQGLTMRSIDWSDLDHPFNPSEIVSGWSSIPSITDYGYTLIKWRDWVTLNHDFVSYEDFTPFIWAKTVVERAFDLIGYTITDNDLTTSDLDRVMSPIPLKNYGEDFFQAKVNVLAELSGTLSYGGGPFITVPMDFNIENQDNGGNYDNVLSEYTAPYNGSYRFKYDAIVNNITGTPPHFIQTLVLINGSVEFPSFTSFTPILNGDTLLFNGLINLIKGDTVTFILKFGSAVGSLDITNGNLQIDGVVTDWKANPPAESTDVFFDFLVDDWELLDYIKGLTQMFNLYIYADAATKTVSIKTRNNYITTSEDWQEKLDYSKQGTKSLLFSDRFIRYKYKNDSSDQTMDFLNDTEPLDIYEGSYQASDPNAEGVTTIENAFFAPTLHIKDRTIAGYQSNDTPPQIPLIWPLNYREEPATESTDYVFLPRVLWHHGIVLQPVGGEPSPEGSISFLLSSPAARNAWPKSFMVDYDDPTGLRKSLSYSTQITTFGATVPGLVETYFLGQLAAVNRGIQVRDWANLKITDILNEEFSTYKVFNGARHVLQKIESYRPEQQQSTKCVFLEDVGILPGDCDRLGGNQLKGLIDQN